MKGRLTEGKKKILDKRLDAIGWGLFLVMIGCLWLIPEGTLHGATWLFGTGMIILVMSWIRSFYQIKVSAFWVFLGVIALGAAMGAWLGINIPLLPALLVIIGLSILMKNLPGKRQIGAHGSE